MQAAQFFRKPAKRVLQRIAPRVLHVLKMERELQSSNAEVELQLLPQLCKKDGVAIDIGAHFGVYTHFMAKFSRWVYAFEPNPDLYKKLTTVAPRNATVRNLALSDRQGHAILRLPASADGQATIEIENCLDRFEASTIINVNVETRRLDEYEMNDVAIIKIDVEGHEASVIRGASDTLGRNKPALIVEIEERHHSHALEHVIELTKLYGYDGWFYFDGQRKEISEFVAQTHQHVHNLSENGSFKTAGYVNNFIFLPSGVVAPNFPF